MSTTRDGAGRTAECRYCHETGLRWHSQGSDRWLYKYISGKQIQDVNGQRHYCDEYRQQQSRNRAYTPPATDDGDDIVQKAIQSNGHTPNGLDKSEVESIARSIAQAVSVSNDNIWTHDLNSRVTGVENRTRESIESILTLMAQFEAKSQASRTIEVKLPDGTVRDVGRQHKQFEDLLAYVALRLHCMLVGPAGSGKSTAAAMVAKALGLSFTLFPMGPAVTDSKLLGYSDANGKTVRTPFREAYENGGVFLSDEMDTANPAALTCLNGALANGHVAFPDGMVARHPDFVFIGGANTYGRGADRMYVGRTQLDAATLDRFITLNWGYDEEFELALAGEDQKRWVLYVQKIRAWLETHSIRLAITPRASIDGALMLRAGIALDKVKAVRIFNNWPADVMAKFNNSGIYY